MGQITELRDWAYKSACEHGWHEKPAVDKVEHMLAEIALIQSEAGEATEAIRTDHRAPKLFSNAVNIANEDDGAFASKIKDTLEDELADVCIRVFDFCGEHGIDIEDHIIAKMVYNMNRPYRHGGKLA